MNESRENNKSLEDNFKNLEELISRMEDPKISLEDSFKCYKEGLTLIKECNDGIDKIEKEIKLLEEDND